MDALGPWHLLIIAAFFVLIFGAKKLPDAARSLGRSARIMKSELKGLHEETKLTDPPAAEGPIVAGRPVEAFVRPVEAHFEPVRPAEQPVRPAEQQFWPAEQIRPAVAEEVPVAVRTDGAR